MNLKDSLLELSDPKYKKFSAKLLPGVENIIGVRIPEIRKIAKQISKNNYKEYLKTAKDDSFEEILLQGLVIGYIEEDIEKILELVYNFIPKINNWSVCDSFCSSLKITKTNKERVFDFIVPYIQNTKEYFSRFGSVMILNYFIDDDYINKSLYMLDNFSSNEYYAKMGVAWAISKCYCKYPLITINYLNNNNLDNFTFNKAIQKILESYAISPEDKKKIKAMKRNNR